MRTLDFLRRSALVVAGLIGAVLLLAVLWIVVWTLIVLGGGLLLLAAQWVGDTVLPWFAGRASP